MHAVDDHAKHQPVDATVLLHALSLAQIDAPAEQRLQQICTALRAALVESTGTAPAWLSEDRRQTLELLAQGLSNRRIARRLDLAEDTIKAQVRTMLDRLNMPNRTALALWAVREGLVSLHSHAAA